MKPPFKYLIMCAVTAFSLTSCSSHEQTETKTPADTPAEQTQVSDSSKENNTDPIQKFRRLTLAILGFRKNSAG